MDIESTPAVTDADRKMADAQRITLNPLHTTVVADDRSGESTRLTENASVTTFEFESENTHEQAAVVPQENTPVKKPFVAIALIATVLVAGIIVAGFLTIQAVAIQ